MFLRLYLSRETLSFIICVRYFRGAPRGISAEGGEVFLSEIETAGQGRFRFLSGAQTRIYLLVTFRSSI